MAVFVVLGANPFQNPDCQGEDEKLMLAALKLSRGELAACVGEFGHLATQEDMEGGSR